MISRLRENFTYKLVALLCALALHWYVANPQTPRQTRTLLVTLAPQNIPDGYDLIDKNVPISVTVEGPVDALERLPDDGVTASVDLTHAHTGLNAGLSIHGEVTTPGTRDLVTLSDIRPQTVSLKLQPERRRRLSLSVAPVGTPAAGFTVARAETIPGDATVIGGADIVDSVARVAVMPHVAGATGPVEEDDPIVAIDTHGNDVADVSVTPDTAHVRVVIVESARERQAFVSPVVTGTPTPGYRVTAVTVVPSTVTVTGSSIALQAGGTVTTDPIDVTGVSTDVARDVRCIPSDGLMIGSPAEVLVTVHIGPISPMAGPQPSVAQPLGGSPVSQPPGGLPGGAGGVGIPAAGPQGSATATPPGPVSVPHP